MSSEPSQSVTVIQPPGRWTGLGLRELFVYRDLFAMMIARDLTVLYKQTVLGLLWAFIRPFFSMVIFTVIFGKLARMQSDGVPYAIFSYVALVPWTYFSTALNHSTMSLINNHALVTKVYLPRLMFPLVGVLSTLVDFAIASLFVVAMMFWYGIAPTANLAYAPILVVLMVLTAAGAGMWLSSLAVLYRDVKHVLPFLVQILMYAAPVVWPASLIEDRLGETARALYGVYPMAGVIEGFRASVLGTSEMPWDLIATGAASSILLFLSGAFFFRKMEQNFADVA